MKIRKASHKRILLTYAFGISGVLIGLLSFLFGSNDGDSLLIYGITSLGGFYLLLQGYLTEEEY